MGNVESAESLHSQLQTSPSEERRNAKWTTSSSSARGTGQLPQRSVNRSKSGRSEREACQLQQMRRTTSLDRMQPGSGQIPPTKPLRAGRKNPRTTTTRKKSERSLNRSLNLADKDIDDIYDFVQHMKQTNLGGDMLEEFVVRQAVEIDGPDKLGGTRLNSAPIDRIQIELETSSAELMTVMPLPASA
jgi:hypothetical protein